MNNFVFIFTNVILPVFVQIATGYILQKKFKLNINVLSKLQLYIFVPSLLFTKVYQAALSTKLLFSIMFYSLVLFGLLYSFSWFMCRLLKFPKPQQSSFINSVCFYNSGNFCLPLIQLLYNSPFPTSVQVIIMTTQNVLTNTVGVFNSNIGKKDLKSSILNVFKVPMAYIVIIALTAKGLNLKIWSPVWSSVDIMGQGMVPTALITLGMQLANTKLSLKIPKVYLSIFMRLFLGPLAAFLIIRITGLHGIIAQVMLISSSAPTAVNSVLLAMEYDNEPGFAAQAVFFSTLLSAFTVSAVIFLAMKYV